MLLEELIHEKLNNNCFSKIKDITMLISFSSIIIEIFMIIKKNQILVGRSLIDKMLEISDVSLILDEILSLESEIYSKLMEFYILCLSQYFELINHYSELINQDNEINYQTIVF